jgi:hypothetical protein
MRRANRATLGLNASRREATLCRNDNSLCYLLAGAPAGVRRFAVRTLMAAGCLAAARFVPFLAYVMSLIGSFLTISVSVIFPAACHLSIFRVSNITSRHFSESMLLCSNKR